MRTLYHWSRKSLDEINFSHNDPRFKVKTQGHAYALDDLDNKSGATSRFEAKSLIVFTEQAAEVFQRHPAVTLMGWKRFFGQYWTRKFLHDIRWNASDAFRCGDVLVIRKAELVPIEEDGRRVYQWLKRGLVFALDAAILLLFADLVVSLNTEWGLFNLFQPRMSFETFLIFEISSLAVLLGAFLLMRVKKSRKADGTEWGYRKELECAMRKAEEARLREEASNSEK